MRNWYQYFLEIYKFKELDIYIFDALKWLGTYKIVLCRKKKVLCWSNNFKIKHFTFLDKIVMRFTKMKILNLSRGSKKPNTFFFSHLFWLLLFFQVRIKICSGAWKMWGYLSQKFKAIRPILTVCRKKPIKRIQKSLNEIWLTILNIFFVFLQLESSFHYAFM